MYKMCNVFVVIVHVVMIIAALPGKSHARSLAVLLLEKRKGDKF